MLATLATERSTFPYSARIVIVQAGVCFVPCVPTPALFASLETKGHAPEAKSDEQQETKYSKSELIETLHMFVGLNYGLKGYKTYIICYPLLP